MMAPLRHRNRNHPPRPLSLDARCARSDNSPLFTSSAQRATKGEHKLHNPPHPGEFIAEVYLRELGVSGRDLASSIGASASTVSRVLNGTSRVTPEMALKLSKALGRTPESWLQMQDTYDLWVARQHVNLDEVRAIA